MKTMRLARIFHSDIEKYITEAVIKHPILEERVVNVVRLGRFLEVLCRYQNAECEGFAK